MWYKFPKLRFSIDSLEQVHENLPLSSGTTEAGPASDAEEPASGREERAPISGRDEPASGPRLTRLGTGSRLGEIRRVMRTWSSATLGRGTPTVLRQSRDLIGNVLPDVIFLCCNLDAEVDPAPCTLHPAPCTLHPAPCTLNPAP